MLVRIDLAVKNEMLRKSTRLFSKDMVPYEPIRASLMLAMGHVAAMTPPQLVCGCSRLCCPSMNGIASLLRR